MSKSDPAPALKKFNLVVSRVFNAPIGLVWKAWTDPQLVMQWWGPDRFTSPSAVIDFREGGKSLVCDGRTEMTVTEHDWTPGHMSGLAKTGLEQCLDKMVKALAERIGKMS